MKRREFLAASGSFAGQVLGAYVLATPALLRAAEAAGLPITSLQLALSSQDGVILLPGTALYNSSQISFNKRIGVKPLVHVLCKTVDGVIAAVRWARTNAVPLAFRSGGHSYEGFSKSSGLVIDVRQMNAVTFDPATQIATVGAGAALGDVYTALGKYGVVIPAGSCPTVGVTGHTLGGGFGLLARPLGLACDTVTEIQLVDADGQKVVANETTNPDLFWACRGGGGGSFGVVTALRFRTHPLATATVFGFSWHVSETNALKLFRAWQNWAPHAPSHITGLLRISRDISLGSFQLRCFGQSTKDAQAVRQELEPLMQLHPYTQAVIETLPFLKAVDHFSPVKTYPAEYMKGKSDYVTSPMSDEGFLTLLQGLASQPAGDIDVICDAYGGAISEKDSQATAFAHRTGTLYCIQYSSSWSSATSTPGRLQMMENVYQSMRPYVSGFSYFNYCDLELKDYPTAYWGANLDRLRSIKAAFDPTNFFRHPQSVPPK